MNTENRIKAHPDAVFTLLNDEKATILHLVTKRYYSLNGTALRIWQLIEEGLSTAEIARQLSREFEIDADQAAERVDSFIEELRSNGLVTIEEEGEGG